MADALSRLDGVVNVKMQGKKALVTFDTEKTDEKKLIEAFNGSGGSYKASKA